jgi:hypothetical protein
MRRAAPLFTPSEEKLHFKDKVWIWREDMVCGGVCGGGYKERREHAYF